MLLNPLGKNARVRLSPAMWNYMYRVSRPRPRLSFSLSIISSEVIYNEEKEIQPVVFSISIVPV